jgi:hypothetical protein
VLGHRLTADLHGRLVRTHSAAAPACEEDTDGVVSRCPYHARMMSRRTLGWVIVGWAAVTWGGRIGLLADFGDLVAWARIALSVAVAVGAAVALLRPSPASRALLWAYAGVTGFVWLTSLVSVWTSPNTFAFRLVHTVLGAVSFVLAFLAGRAASSDRIALA